MSETIAHDAINDERDTEITLLTAELEDAEKRASGACYLRFLSMSDEMKKLEADLAAIENKIDLELCDKCNYQRSIAAPCKCGQIAVKGTNDRLRAELEDCKDMVVKLIGMNADLTAEAYAALEDDDD